MCAQPRDQHFEHLAEGRGEVEPHGRERRVGLVGGQHRGRRMGVRPQRGGCQDHGSGQAERGGIAQLGYAPEEDGAERTDAALPAGAAQR